MTDDVAVSPEAEGLPVDQFDLATKDYVDRGDLEHVWMPLTSKDPASGDVVLVIDADESLVPTRVPLS